MKVNTKLKMLPLSYLEKIGRYDTKLHRGYASWPGYPRNMMNELQKVAKEGEEVKFIRNCEPPKGILFLYKHKKFITVRIESSEHDWVIPSNWVVKV